MTLEQIQGTERESLFPIRAAEWRGPMTEQEFSTRNKRLYAHPFGKKITTYALKDKNQILASMDILQVPLLTKDKDGIKKEEAFLLASCVVAKELRGQGHAKKLIEQFLEQNGTKPGVLYSDIGPKYYNAFQFNERRIFVVEGKAEEKTPLTIKPIPLPEFVTELTAIREKDLADHPEGAICLAPDLELFEWQIERHKYFCELKGRAFPKDVTFKVQHGHYEHILFSVPNPVKDRQEGLWVTSGCILCEEALAHQAFENKLSVYMYWDLLPPLQVKDKECPMARTSHSSTLFLDPQLCDWW